MDYKLELEKLNANMIEDKGLVEVYFDEKTDFIKHIVDLHNIDIEFNADKECFVLNEQEQVKIEKFIEKVSLRPTIIFDMDGVIMNTNDSFPVATSNTYKHYTGEELTFDEINEIKYKGGFNSDWDILMYLFDEKDIQKMEKVPNVECVIPRLECGEINLTCGKYRTFRSWMNILVLSPDQVETLDYKISQGRNLEEGEEDGILIGSEILTYFTKNGEIGRASCRERV